MSHVEILRTQILEQNPTDEQKAAIFSEEFEFLLRASPGSGKTWTSCRRFIWRGANWNYKVGGLALLSFTNTAIREFHEATINVGRRALLSYPNFVGTFDSFVEQFIISPFGHTVTGSKKRPSLFLAPRPGDRNNKKLQAWVEVKGGRKIPVPAWEIVPFTENRKITFLASLAYGNKPLDLSVNNPVLELFKMGFYTHVQRVYLAYLILKKNPRIAKCLARRFPEIIVDEAQDTNIWLLIVLDQLRKDGAKVTLIGDPDQCIYEFNLASVDSLLKLKAAWNISEKLLSKSFRCNNHIADCVRNISGNLFFVGCGPSPSAHHQAFVVRESSSNFRQAITAFEGLLGRSGISQSKAIILCRAHQQLEAIRGSAVYNNFKGMTKEIALASFHRDVRKDYKKAFQIMEQVIRDLTDEPGFWESLDDAPDSIVTHRIRLALWKFTKSPDKLPSLSENATDWIEKLKTNLVVLFSTLEIPCTPKMGLKIKRTGLNTNQLALPLFKPQSVFPPIRQETIHKVKGESIDGVLVLASGAFFNGIVKAIASNENLEDRRLAYVAMTRARHSLLIGLPAAHYDKHLSTWKQWGFGVL
jgi:superfamily I DNA/RNA helicase